MKNAQPNSKFSRIFPAGFAALLLLRLVACNGTVDTGGGGQDASAGQGGSGSTGGQGGAGAHGGTGGQGGALPDPPQQACMTDGDCQPTSTCLDDYRELDFIMPTCGADGFCKWAKQVVDCPDGICEGGFCGSITDTAGGT
jgi:hypothetical protein